jgi:hypothetical protein
MALYFLLLDEARFSGEIVPALAASWRERSFAPCRALCQSLHPTAAAFGKQYYLGSGESMLDAVLRGAAFDRVFWRALAGEILWFTAAEVPEVPTSLESLLPLLGYPGEISLAREQLVPIQQAHYGSRDLVFGSAFYRPASAGYNDRADVVRLAEYFAGVDPDAWQAAALSELAEAEERDEELDYARQCFTALRDMYQRVQVAGQIVVCEEM